MRRRTAGAWVASENILIVYNSGTWSPVSTGGGGGGGVMDHGMLTGLADDDHLQYLTASRGDARYTPWLPVIWQDGTTRFRGAMSVDFFFCLSGFVLPRPSGVY